MKPHIWVAETFDGVLGLYEMWVCRCGAVAGVVCYDWSSRVPCHPAKPYYPVSKITYLSLDCDEATQQIKEYNDNNYTWYYPEVSR